MSDKQFVYEKIHPILMNAHGFDAADKLLDHVGFDLYRRGKSWGVKDQRTGRRYRLHTLGLLPVFERAIAKEPWNSKSTEEKRANTQVQKDPRGEDLLRQRMTQHAKETLDRFDRDDR